MSDASSDLQDSLRLAHRLRAEGSFQQAAAVYLRILQHLPRQAETHHNLALCLLGLGQSAQAVQAARRALAINPGLTPARLILARALRTHAPESDEPQHWLRPIASQPGSFQDHARLALAEFSLNYECDAQRSIQWVQDVPADSPLGEQVSLSRLSASLYERGPSGKALGDIELTDHARQHAQRFLNQGVGGKPVPSKPIGRRRSKRPCVVVLSCALQSGPVYAMGYDSLRALSEKADLIFFHRGQKTDQQTQAFQALASRWVDCWQWDWKTLADALGDCQADVLLEMSGWMDPDGLKAVSTRPARRQYKWVGGQSITTGLECFDGYIGDESQIPAQAESLYTEPILRIQPSYAGFRWPGGRPPAARKKNARAWGLIGNPTKISSALPDLLAGYSRLADLPQELRFIDRKYQRAVVRQRIEGLLARTRFKPIFVVPKDQAEFTTEVAGLGVVLDTAPYSAGLTAREALNLGAKLLSHPNSLIFCARHGLSALNAPRGQGGIDLAAAVGL